MMFVVRASSHHPGDELYDGSSHHPLENEKMNSGMRVMPFPNRRRIPKAQLQLEDTSQ
jgi:hypothetical protein